MMQLILNFGMALVSEKTLWKQQELEEEKKSVRFNLDKELNITFKLSDSSSSESSSEVQKHTSILMFFAEFVSFLKTCMIYSHLIFPTLFTNYD